MALWDPGIPLCMENRYPGTPPPIPGTRVGVGNEAHPPGGPPWVTPTPGPGSKRAHQAYRIFFFQAYRIPLPPPFSRQSSRRSVVMVATTRAGRAVHLALKMPSPVKVRVNITKNKKKKNATTKSAEKKKKKVQGRQAADATTDVCQVTPVTARCHPEPKQRAPSHSKHELHNGNFVYTPHQNTPHNHSSSSTSLLFWLTPQGNGKLK